MIKIRTMSSLYNMYIRLQIQKKQEAIENQKILINSMLEGISSIKPFIEHYVNYNDLLNGKISTLPESFKNVIPKYKAYNLTIKNYSIVYNVLLKYEEEIYNLKKEEVKYEIYKYIVSLFNKAVVENMIKTGKAFNHVYFGTLEIYYKENHSRSVDWDTSNKNKARLIANGQEPYLRKNAIEAKRANREYNGIKWLVKREGRPMLSLKWSVAPKILKEIKREGGNYQYFPARGNFGIISFFMKVYENPNHDYNIYNTQ